MKLRDYQEECLESIFDALDEGCDRQMVVMATGSGKTLTFAHIPQALGGKTLVLAHRKELLDQTAATMQLINPRATIEIEQAERHATSDADIVIASTATLGRGSSDRLEKFDPDHFTTVIADECHRARSETWERILEHFTPELRIGFTATPQRGDGAGLYHLFDEIVYFKPMKELIEEGWLVDFVGYRLATGTDISKVGVNAGDYKVGELSEAVNTPSRNRYAVAAYKELAPGSKAMAFCVDVQHAKDVAKTFRKAGITSYEVVGTTPPDVRQQRLDDFSDGSIQVLTNVAVAVEGYDEPSIQTILWLRPTKSPLFFTQGVGRGARLHEDKEHCLFLDFVDVTSATKPIGLPTLMGLPADFDTDGKPLTEVAEEFKKLEETAPAEAARARSLQDLDKAWERIDMFLPPPPNEELLEFSTLIWMEPSPGHWVLNISMDERMEIVEDTLGRYTVTLTSHGTEYELGVVQDMKEAFSRSDRWIKKYRNDNLKLLDRNADWRQLEPTDKQKRYLRKHNVPDIEGLSRGEASRILTKLFEDNPRPREQLSAKQRYAIRQKERNDQF